MHLWAFENAAKSDGERYIACKGFGPVQAAADILHEKYKDTKIGERIVVGNPGEGYLGYNKETKTVDDVVYLPAKPQVSGKKAERVMGIKWISFKQSINDTADVLEALLWICLLGEKLRNIFVWIPRVESRCDMNLCWAP